MLARKCLKSSSACAGRVDGTRWAPPLTVTNVRPSYTTVQPPTYNNSTTTQRWIRTAATHHPVCNDVLREKRCPFSKVFILSIFEGWTWKRCWAPGPVQRDVRALTFTCLRWNHGDQSSLTGRPSFFSVYRVDVVGILASVSPLLVTKEQERFKPQRM